MPWLGMPTGQPLVHCSPDQLVSKKSIALPAWEPKNVTNWLSTADLRAAGDMALY